MTRCVAFLRGVNVGGRNKVPMAELRALMTELGHEDVRTHLQSGNAVFTSAETDTERLARDLERAIADRFGFPVRCTVRSADELRAVVERCPFDPGEHDPAKLTVTFLTEPPRGPAWEKPDPDAHAPETFRLGEREIYAYSPGGLGRSKLMPVLSRLGEDLGATTRNWNTVTKLLALAEER